MDGFKVGHVFVHLFLTVAGGFAHHQIGEIEVGAFIGFPEAVTAFYQRAQVARQIFFGFFNGFIRCRAQRNDNRARSHGNFLRHESAIGADQRYPLLFEIHDGDKTFLAGL